MNEEKITLNLLDGNTHAIEIRHGEALKLREPIPLKITGNLPTVTDFLSQRVQLLDQKKCHVVVDRGKSMSIILVTDETSYYAASVTGEIMFDEDFLAFGINTGKKYTLRELSDFIKMHRYCFQDKDVAMKLVTELRNFKAKVNKEIEKVGDTRGNKHEVLSQVVDSNIPESFTLAMPIFKGISPFKFAVEINIIVRDADMDCTLESVEANDLVKETRETVFNEQVDQIKQIAPDIVIIEV